MINIDELKQSILDKSDLGLDVFRKYENVPDNLKKKFISSDRDEKTPSTSIKLMQGAYVIKDFGDVKKAMNCFDYMMMKFNLSFMNACTKIIQDLGLSVDLGNMDLTKDWKLPVFKNYTNLPEEAVHLLKKDRGLNQETLKLFQLFSEKHFFGQLQKELPSLAFPYFEGDVIVNAKYYRKERKNEKGEILEKKQYELHKDAKRIFFNANDLDNYEKMILVEGEFDTLSVKQAIMNSEDFKDYGVISVSNGVNSLSDNLLYVGSKVSKIKEWIIFVDSDTAGFKLSEEFSRRVGRYKCRKVKNYGIKDANKMLVEFGEQMVIRALLESEQYKVEGLIVVNDLSEKIRMLYEGERIQGLTTGLKSLDNIFTWAESQLTVITGVPRSGKSALLDQILIKLSEHHSWKHGMFSPEYPNLETHIMQLCEIYKGKMFKRFPNDVHPNLMNENDYHESIWFIGECFKFYEPEINHEKGIVELVTQEKLFEAIRSFVEKFGLNTFVIDPFNKIHRENYIEQGWINSFFQQLSYIKKIYGIHIIIVAHPKQLKVSGTVMVGKGSMAKEMTVYYKPSLYDIYGGSEIANQIDNLLILQRNFLEDTVEVETEKVKLRTLGRYGKAELKFDLDTGRYYDVLDEETKSMELAGYKPISPNIETIDNFGDKPPF